ncbi:MAG: nitrilase, partial [Chloroflexi bacterium]|nr:nitrilase [Chloroflexota bacterium]
TSLMEPPGHIARHVIPARAIENQLYIAYANRIGTEHELRYVGRSVIYDPEGTLLAEGTDDSADLIVATIAKSAVAAARSDFSYVQEASRISRLNTKIEPG